ncbi:aromatic compound dioxygenase [Coniochaeta sp. PMI_546]|nr:aromatic compound dioxygenase [Coniochaeta sp. PMI_546]
MLNLKALITAALAGSSLLGVAVAHPGETHSAEKIKKSIAARDLGMLHSKRLVEKCATSPKHQALRAKAAARRSMTAQVLREKRDIGSRHDYTLSTPESIIFTSNATAALTPETIIGPYFVAGEYIRSDVTETQAGVPIHLDIQFIDIATCEAVPNMLVDIWHANATGVYSGVEAAGQGGLNSTFLRGIQVTDHDGVTQFDSIFPGHYTGRTNHIHVASRRGGRILPNGTYTGGTVNHIGQLYFDEELSIAIETFEPYARNPAARTTNRGDFLTADEATADYDPFVSYVKLSDDANDGLLMWITVGVNTTADYDDLAVAAAHYYQGGGKSNSPPGGCHGYNFKSLGFL